MPININGSKGIRQNTTEVTKIPVGTTAQRPANPEPGMIRFNTDEGDVEWYDDLGDRWIPTSSFPGVVATGGTVTDIEQDGQLFRVHTFTSDGTFDVARGGKVEYLVVAGGGGGLGPRAYSSAQGSGGGAGGLVNNVLAVGIGTINVEVGNGGAGNANRDSTTPGENSIFGNIVALGGGGAVDSNIISSSNGDGGSGGGDVSGGPAGSALQPTSLSGGFGNDGGFVNPLTSGREFTTVGGGGGGAGQKGFDGKESPEANAGNGGDGLQVFGNFYAGGGGGGSDSNPGGVGGNGGGGNGSDNGSQPTAGQSNTGGGGGGGTSAIDGAAGGSGIVIVRYRIG